jgi:hypothetical protein
MAEAHGNRTHRRPRNRDRPDGLELGGRAIFSLISGNRLRIVTITGGNRINDFGVQLQPAGKGPNCRRRSPRIITGCGGLH